MQSRSSNPPPLSILTKFMVNPVNRERRRKLQSTSKKPKEHFQATSPPEHYSHCVVHQIDARSSMLATAVFLARSNGPTGQTGDNHQRPVEKISIEEDLAPLLISKARTRCAGAPSISLRGREIDFYSVRGTTSLPTMLFSIISKLRITLTPTAGQLLSPVLGSACCCFVVPKFTSYILCYDMFVLSFFICNVTTGLRYLICWS